MSGAGASAGAAAAAAAAAHRAALLRLEEEDLTGYSNQDLDGWEFKIVRANTRKFKNASAVKQLCEEEAKAGWEMIEKFDDTRIRFKRKTEHRNRDQYLDIDPYRSVIGMESQAIVLMVLGILVAVGGILAFVLMMGR